MANKVNFVYIPQELKENAAFCVWKKEKRQGKPTKVPYNPRNGRLAKTNEPETFTDFNTAMKTFAMGGYDGIGYRVYSNWCNDMNYHPDNYKNFRAAMEKTYRVERKRPKAGGDAGLAMIIGVRLRAEEVGAEDEEGEVFKPLADEGALV